MPAIEDLTKAIVIEKIEHDFESADEACRISNEAFDIVSQLKKIRKAAEDLDSLVSTLYKRSLTKNTGARYALDEVLTEESDILNTADELAKDINVQIARYEGLITDAENAAACFFRQENSNARYGSYEDQVRGDYYASR